jgi:hypothetical protein
LFNCICRQSSDWNETKDAAPLIIVASDLVK